MMCGLEIHQRLVGKKLFCSCFPSDEAGAKTCFSRRLHTVRSELGEVDAAARAEASRSRTFSYTAPAPSTCLVETDDEPPHALNRGALHAIITVCQLLSSQTVDELHIMRKNVIDGSNTSGFQRTAVVGMGGSIATPSGALPIQTICIEEESAGIVGGREGAAQYDLSRLGIPLVEIATAPTLHSGKEAEGAALAIGTLLRKTGMVSRGIGTIRQDLNISIPAGARVEIKGVQDLQLIALTVDLEVKRQENLLIVLNEAKSRLSGKLPPESIFDLTESFSNTACSLVAKGLKGKARVLGTPLPKYAGLLGREISPGRRFASELADYARAFGVRGLVHSDENLEKYGISDDEISEIRVALSLGREDAFMLVVADEKKARAALSAAFGRALNFSITEETRRANPDGTSSYMRPLPGRARMYPETDVEPIEITKEMISGAKKAAASIKGAEKEAADALLAINDELSAQLSSAKGLLSHSPAHKSRAPTPELSVYLSATEAGVDAKLAASTITNTLQTLKREGVGTRALDEERLISALVDCKNGVFAKAAMQDILRAMCKEIEIAPSEAAHKLGLEKITGSALAALISEEKLDLARLMAKYRLRVDATEAGQYMGKKG